MMLARRGFLSGLVAALAAPAVVRASSLMPVSAPKLIVPGWHEIALADAADELKKWVVTIQYKILELTEEDRAALAAESRAAIDRAVAASPA